MGNQGHLQFGISFNVDKTRLNELRTELQSLQKLTAQDLIKSGGSIDTVQKDLETIKATAQQVEAALVKSFNPKLNSQDLTKFKTTLSQSNLTIGQIKASFDKAGQSGRNAFRNLTTEILTTNKQLKQSSALVNRMADTMANTIRWSIASTALNTVTRSIQKAWSYTKQLDSALNDIQIVTNKSAEDMDRFAVKANKAAQALGSTTKAYADAALIYYQQGLSEKDVQARTTVTTKVANVTGQSAAEVSENLTAVWNGYKVSAQEAELYIDKLSAVAATTAADLGELSVGMSRVASAANIMGVDIDSLNAQLATIVSVTREAPESIGTALKTVYARMSDIESGLDTETTLGEYTAQMKAMGVNVLDATGNLRDMDDVIEEIGNNWNNLSRNQQVSLAQTIAGTRQYSRMMALFDNWDMYQSAKTTSQTSAGELQKQQETYLKSMQAHLNQLTSASEELYRTLMDPKGLNPLIDALTKIVQLTNNFVESIGGGIGLLGTLGTVGLSVFEDKLTRGLTRFITNQQAAFSNRQIAQSEQFFINQFDLVTNNGQADERTRLLVEAAQSRARIAKQLTAEEQQQSLELIKQTNEFYKQKDALEEQKKSIEDITQRYTGQTADFANPTQTAEGLKTAAESIQDSSIKTTEMDSVTSLTDAYFRLDAAKRLASARDQEFTNDTNASVEAFNAAIAAIERQDRATASYNDTLTLTRTSIKDVIDLIKRQTDVTQEDSLIKKANADQAAELAKIQATVSRAFNDDGSIRGSAEDVRAAREALERYNAIVKDMASKGSSAATTIEHLGKQLKQNAQNTEQVEAALKRLKEQYDLTAKVNQTIKLTGAVSSLAMGITTLQRLGSIWKNEDLSTGEKILQTVLNLSTAIGMLGRSFLSFREAIAFFKELKALSSIKATAANAAEATSEKVLRDQIHKTNLKKKERVANNQAQAGSSGEVTTSNLAEAASEKSKQAGGQGKGLSNLKGGIKKFGKLGGAKFGGIAGGIGGAIAGAAVAIGVFSYIADAQKRAAEAAAESATFMQETLSSVTAQYQSLKTAVDNLGNATETLEGLTEGTAEWKQALFEVNNQVLDLLRQYPELNQYIRRDSNGQLVVEKEGLALIQENQLKAMQRSQAASLTAQAQSDSENIKYLAEEWEDEENNSDNWGVGSAVGGLIGGAAAGAGIGAVVGGPWGALIGLAAGAVIGGVSGLTGGLGAEAAEDDILASQEFKKAFEQYKISGDAIFDSNANLAAALGKTEAELTAMERALVDNKEATKALCEAMLQNEAQEYARWVQIGEGILGAGASEGAKALAGKEAVETEAISYDEVKDKYWGFNDADEKAIKKLLELSDIGTYVGVTGINKVQYRDKQSNEIVEKDIDWVYKQLQYYLAIEKAQGKGSQYEASVKSLTGLFSDTEVKKAVQGLITGTAPDLRQLTRSEYESLVSEADEASKTLTEEQREALQDSLTAYNAAWHQAITSLPQEIQASFKAAIATLDLNVDQIKYASTLYNDLFETLGNQGAEVFVSLSDALGDNFGEFLDGLSAIDLDSGNIEDQLQSILTELDIEDVDGKVLREFADALEFLTDAASGSLEAMQKHYKDVYQVALHLKQFDTVSADFYDKLSSGQKKYFQLMADGTYQLIKDAKDFYGLTQETFTNSLQEQITTAINGLSLASTNKTKLETWETDTEGDIYQEYLAVFSGINLRKEQAESSYKNSPYFGTTVPVIDTREHWATRATKYVPIEEVLAAGEITDATQLESLEKVEPSPQPTYQIGPYEISEETIDRFFAPDGVIENELGHAVQNYFNYLSEKASLEAEEASADSVFRAGIENRYAEAQAAYETAVSVLEDLIPQYLASLQSFQQYRDALTFLTTNKLEGKVDDELQKNTLLRIAAQQYDLRAADDTYLSKEAIDEYIGEENLKNIDKYTELLAQVALGFQKVDAMQQAALRSLKKYENEAKNVGSAGSVENFQDQMEAQFADIHYNETRLNAYRTTTAGPGYKQKELRATLTNAGFTNLDGDKDNGIAGLFNPDGSINTAGYMQLLDAYSNAEFASDAEAATVRAALDSVEQYITDYDAIVDDIETGIANYQDLALQKFNFVVNLELDTNNAKKEFESFRRDIKLAEGDFSAIGTSYLSDVMFGFNNLGMINSAFTELENLKNSGEITQAQYEARQKELIQSFEEEIRATTESLENYEQTRLDAINAISDAYQKQIDVLENVNSLLEHQKTLTELQYGDAAASQLTTYYTTLLNNANAVKNANEASYDYWSGLYASSAGKSQEEIDVLYEKMSESAQAYATSLTDAIEIAQEQYINNLTVALYTLDQTLTKQKGIEMIKEEWDWTMEKQEQYLTSLDAIFEKEKLTNAYRKAINNNTNLKAQEKIKTLMDEQLNNLKLMDKISEQDIKRAQQKLEILQAEIALQEAQDAKTKMRLIRGADGSYSYQYTADESSIIEAREKLADANQKLYQLDYSRYQNGLNTFYTAYTKYQDAMKEAWNDGKLTDDEDALLDARKARLKELAQEAAIHEANLNETVTSTLASWGMQTETATSYMGEMFNTSLQDLVESFQAQTEETASAADTAITTFNNTVKTLGQTFVDSVPTAATTLNTLLNGDDGKSGVIGAYNTFATSQNAVINNYKDELTALDTLYTNYMAKYKGMLEIYVSEYDNIHANVYKTNTAITNENTHLNTLWTDYTGKYQDMLTDMAKDYKDAADSLTAINTELAKLPTSGDGLDNTSVFADTVNYVNNMAKAWKSYTDSRKAALAVDGYTVNTDGTVTWTGYPAPSTSGTKAPGTGIGYDKPDDPIVKPDADPDPEPEPDYKAEFGAWLDEVGANNRRGGIGSLSMADTQTLQDYKVNGNLTNREVYNVLAEKITGGSIDNVTVSGQDKSGKWYSDKHTTDKLTVSLDGSSYNVEFRNANTNDSPGPESEGSWDTLNATVGGTPKDTWIAAYNNEIYMYRSATNAWHKLAEDKEQNKQFREAYFNKLRGYKTGGLADFTGPAWLDGTKTKPELVLNQNDTTNFLDALKILRSINLSMMQNVSGLSNVSARFSGVGFGATPIEQTVHITAEFPDATDAEEIKEAFNELVNLATQKALEHKF